jgi:hypothetical protein
MAWRTGALRVVVGELERRGSATFVWGPGSRAPTSSCGPRLSRRWKLVRRVVGGGDFLYEQVVGGEAESPRRARRRLLVRDGNWSSEVEPCRARRKVFVQDENLSCETEPCCVRRRLVVRVTFQSEVDVLPVRVLTKICILPYPGS